MPFLVLIVMSRVYVIYVLICEMLNLAADLEGETHSLTIANSVSLIP